MREKSSQLTNLDQDGGLVISGGRKDLGLAGRDDSVAGNELGHDTTGGFNSESQGVDIHQNNVTSSFLSGKDTTLDSGTESDGLVRVDTLASLLSAKELLEEALDLWNTGRTTNQNDVVNLALLDLGILEDLLNWLERLLEQIVVEFFELGSGKGLREIVAIVESFDFNTGGHLGGKSTLGLLNLALKFTHGLEILGDIDVVLLVVQLHEVVDNSLVEIFTTQVSITSGSQNLEDTVVDGQEGDIESTTTEIVDDDLALVTSLVETVGNSCGGGFVDDAENVQSGDDTSVLGGLSLVVVEVSWDGNNGVGNGFSEVVLSDVLHLSKNHGGDLLGSEVLRCPSDIDLDLRLAILVNDLEGEMLSVLLNITIIELAANKTPVEVDRSVTILHKVSTAYKCPTYLMS